MQPSLFSRSRVVGPESFEIAWNLYPDRHVSENKRDALKQWLARIREGAAAGDMVEGARRYRAYCDRLRLTGTEYVMQPRRFFGASRHFELDWKINGGRIIAQEQRSSAVMQKLQENERRALKPADAIAVLQEIRTAFQASRSR